MKNQSDIEVLVKLPADEETAFTDFIRVRRSKLISSPKDTAKRATENNKETIVSLLEKKELSAAIILLRELSYQEFLKEEAHFNGEILKSLGNKFATPKEIIKKLSSRLYYLSTASEDEFKSNLLETIGQYTGAISPYIYQLCLSNTQSRRSRAGKTFEGIIYFLYEHFKYPFDSQSQVGKKVFDNLGLGKIVDSILPGIEVFKERRDKTIIGTMKTTLRERWQEVVEEVSRSNVPSIYLLTVDDDISENKIIQMANHNIVLVVPKEVKAKKHLVDKRSVIDFETYFLKEIPSVMEYWND